MTDLWLEPGLEYNVGIVLGEDKVYSISSQDDIDALPVGVERVFVEFNDWKVVPTENVLAKYTVTKVFV